MKSQVRMTAVPNFLVIGAMKSGTTSLYHYLRAHPKVFMSPVKEVAFFVEEANWTRGLDWYTRQFGGAGAAIAIGEASTAYTKYPRLRGVPERIATLLPDVRLIYVVRDPVERIRSHYDHRVAIGAERLPIREAVRREPIYVDCSRYALQLEQYVEWFPRDRFLVFTAEELRASRIDTVQRAFGFLGVDPHELPAETNREFYKTDERAIQPPAALWFRRNLKRYVPASKRAKELVDWTIPRTLGRLFGKPDGRETHTAISPELREELLDALRDDVRRLHRWMPEGFDGWGIV